MTTTPEQAVTARYKPMLFGYARISHHSQDISSQIDELRALGCEDDNIFQEVCSSNAPLRERHKLMEAIRCCRYGDTLYATEFSRLARSIDELKELATKVLAKGATLHVTRSSIVLSPDHNGKMSPTTELILTLFGAVSKFERDLTKERCAAGRASYIERGGKLGPKGKLKPAQHKELLAKAASGKFSKQELADHYNISLSSVYKRIQKERKSK